MEWILIAIVVAFIVWRMKPAKGVKTISTTELRGILNEKSKQFVDVRTTGEYKGRHISQFQNIPLDQLPSKLTKLDASKETIVLCQSGMRSSRAAGILKKAGFTNVVNVRGGMSQWQ
ncbi:MULTISPECIES: rhodanese-like domain-containing protein [Paenisporosarcina]|uniref:Rhodanese-like domain-containing protein n=1 Tax=Paenisporosarcina antarctica TaxID=417367 RepID=A0A4P7A1G0_9BACL|nr:MULTISPECIES: rhodanese-like domain-containing protein [Paenisporosarcina]QBP41736.1 rhodanese-like domain-containing protein [Paenisporosarcina antarctica]